MDLRRNIDIGIASEHARRGATRVKAALDSIIRKSRAMAASSRRDTASMRSGFAGVRTLILSLGGALAGRSMIQSTKDFGQAIADLSAITGASGKDLEFLRSESKRMGETTTLSASQAAEAFRLIASAKPDLLSNVKALSLVTEEAIALAEATGDTLPVAAATLGSSLNQFNKGADEASRFINVLAAGSKFGAAQVSEMAEALKFAGGIASNMAEITFEETNASLQLLSQFAIKGGEAGTQLRMILLSLETQTNEKFKPSVVGLNTALDNLATAQMTSAESARLFGSRNVNAASILIQQKDRVAELTKQLTGTNIAYEQQAIRVDTLSGDVKALKSAYEGLELTIGRELNGSLRAMTQAATENIRALSQNPLLQTRTRALLDGISTALQDIRNVFRSLKDQVKTAAGEVISWRDAWEVAINNTIKLSKDLWRHFVVGGPANLKLAMTMLISFYHNAFIKLNEIVKVATVKMVSQFDIFRIGATEKVELAVLAIVKLFVQMKQAVAEVFDGLKLTVAGAIDAVIGEVQQKLFGLSRSLGGMGFDDLAMQMTDMGIALGKVATAGSAAHAAALEHERARQAELRAIEDIITATENDADTKRKIAKQTADEVISEIRATADERRKASFDAVQLAIEERDATIAAIEDMRNARKEVGDSGPEQGPPVELAGSKAGIQSVTDAVNELGESSKLVVAGLADGFSEAAATGKASFSDMARSILQDLIRIQIRAQIVAFLTKLIGGFGGGGSTVLASAEGVVGPPAFATGGEFKVGGSGGPDSQLVAFKASPDETVSIRTPSQQGRMGGGVTINQYNSLNVEGDADENRLATVLPAWGEQVKQETLAAVLAFRDKGTLQIL